MSLTRRQILAGAATTAAVAAMPAAAAIEVGRSAPMSIEDWVAANIELPNANADGQTFRDGKILWTYYARRREWIGIDDNEREASPGLKSGQHPSSS